MSMAIVSHRHRFIFLKSRKTAGSSIEIWLAPYLDPQRDRAAMTADLATCRPDLVGQFESGNLRPHGTAKQVRKLVGEDMWHSYYKFSVERNPFDRILSLWRWRDYHRQHDISFDEFLAAIVDGSPDRLKVSGARNWSNWPIYTIGNNMVADEVIRYENLNEGLGRVLSNIGIAFDGDLPRAKAGIREARYCVESLTNEQIEVISQIFRREIEYFKYAPIGGTDSLSA